MDIALRDGTPANRLATDLKQYLKHPDKLFAGYGTNTDSSSSPSVPRSSTQDKGSIAPATKTHAG